MDEKKLTSPDYWLLSKLQETTEVFTVRLEACEYNLASAMLEDFVIEHLSRLYVPMVRKELWTDDPATLERRWAVYATLWHVLKTVTLLFNPFTPYLCEALHQGIYKKFDPGLSDSVNFEKWPQADTKMRNETLEKQFDTLFKCVSLTYAARQSARLKRRWPLRTMIIAVSDDVCNALRGVEDLLLELSNVKTVDFVQKARSATEEGWVSATEGEIQVYLDARRDEELLGEGLMRDLARRIQALRKELGYMPTDILETVHIADLEKESMVMLQPYLKTLADLVRAKRVQLHADHEEAKAEWHEIQMDDKKISIAIAK
jgi:isoleucyl-tRNA synthetase